MAVFKCKMCGGALEIVANETVATCEYCGTQQTLPKLDDDRRAQMYDRANHFRRNNEYDKAMGVYEHILNEDNTDAEAYWSLVLCRYGIEYVEDPATHKRVPTVNRAQFTSVFDDDNYKSAIKYADMLQKTVYEAEATTINEIQKGILAISQKEEPFDVFICYKETDNSGRRTPDSVLANDLYHLLSQEGFKVFFSRITLEDKLGTAYEPYIFAALNSAKVMVVLGTKPEYFNAVWVKNEWSRYLSLVKQSAGKKMLIPAFKDMEPYDLPDEFSHLQAQDMSKLGFMQDLIRGIKKIISADAPATAVKETVVVNNTAAPTNTNIAPLLERAFMFLEDGDFNSGNEYAEKVLDIDPKCAEAYFVKLMAETGTRKREDLKNLPHSFEGSINCQKLMRFGDDALKNEIRSYIGFILNRNEMARKEGIYQKALAEKGKNTPSNYDEAIRLFSSIIGYRDVEKQIDSCKEHKKECIYKLAITHKMKKNPLDYNEAIRQFSVISGFKDSNEQINECRVLKNEYYYLEGKKFMSLEDKTDFTKAIESFSNIKGYKDAATLIEVCENKIKQLEVEAKDKAEKSKKKTIKLVKIVSPIVAVVIIFVILLNTIIIPTMDYNKAIALMEEKKYTQAIAAFEALDSYKDSSDKIDSCYTAIKDEKYNKAVKLMEEKQYFEAIAIFEAMGRYKDSANKISECNAKIKDEKYNDAVKLMEVKKYSEAISAFEAMDGYKDSNKNIVECEIAIIRNCSVNDTVQFGTYEQDNNTFNGVEAIEWILLAREEDRVLVISKYALDSMPYNISETDVTWEKCTIRNWLNNDFLNAAFSEEKKAKILTVNVSADKNPEYNTNPGIETKDKIFLLSIVEAEKYFTTDEARECVPTEYALDQGAYTLGNKDTCWWWLRSPGDSQNRAADVFIGGSTLCYGDPVNEDSICVRPAMWISLDS